MSVAAETPGPIVTHATLLPLLGVTVASTWIVIAGLSSLAIQWPRLDTYTLCQVRIPEAIVQVLLVALVPLLLTPIPSQFRTRAIALFASAGILWVAISIGSNVWIGQIGGVISMVLHAIGWMRLRGRPSVVILTSAAIPILWGLMYYLVGANALWTSSPWSRSPTSGPSSGGAVWALTFLIFPVGVSAPFWPALPKPVDPDVVVLAAHSARAPLRQSFAGHEQGYERTRHRVHGAGPRRRIRVGRGLRPMWRDLRSDVRVAAAPFIFFSSMR